MSQIQDKHNTIMVDQQHLTGATLMLLTASVGLAVLYGMGTPNPLYTLPKPLSGSLALASSVLFLGLGLGLQKGHVQAAWIGASACALWGLGCLYLGALGLSIVALVMAGLVWRGGVALQRTHSILSKAEDTPPAYRRQILHVAILTKLMQCDGDTDQRERQILRLACADIEPSQWHQKMLQQEARGMISASMEELVREYVQITPSSQRETNNQDLLQQALDMIAADGIVAYEERRLFLKLGQLLGAPESRLYSQLSQLSCQLDDLCPQTARAVLNIKSDTSPTQTQQAYKQLRQALIQEPTQAHLKQDQQARLERLDQAYQILQQS